MAKSRYNTMTCQRMVLQFRSVWDPTSQLTLL